MPILLILFLLAACSPVPWPEPVVGRSKAIAWLLTTAIMGAVAARAFRVCKQCVRWLNDPAHYGQAVSVYHRFRSRQMVWLMLGFVMSLMVGGWGWVVGISLTNEEGILRPCAELAIVAPFFVAWIASWFAYYPVECLLDRTSGHAPLSKLQFLLFQARQHFVLVCFPLGLVVCEQSITRTFPEVMDSGWFRAATVACVMGVLIFAPLALRWMLGLSPLSPGPLRTRLEQLARRLKFRHSDFLYWDTRGHAANAMVAGLLPRPRYVLFTDRLLDEMTPDEIEAVLGHEIGHVRRRHLLLYVVFLSLSMLTLAGLDNLVYDSAEAGSWTHAILAKLGAWQVLPATVLTAGYVFLAFGFLSRRCEREADLEGCRAVSCGQVECTEHRAMTHELPITDRLCPTGIDTFISALERVAVANGIDRKKPGIFASWQHSTIAKRVEFLEQVRRDPKLEQQFRTKLLFTKAVFICVLAALVAALAWAGQFQGLV